MARRGLWLVGLAGVIALIATVALRGGRGKGTFSVRIINPGAESTGWQLGWHSPDLASTYFASSGLTDVGFLIRVPNVPLQGHLSIWVYNSRGGAMEFWPYGMGVVTPALQNGQTLTIDLAGLLPIA